MDDNEKAMHALGLHQDALLWSRVRTSLAVQAGTLAGGFALAAERPLAIVLISLGMGLTLLLIALIRRDLVIRDRAFEASGAPLPDPGRRRKSLLREREILRLVYLLLFAADITLLVWTCLDKT